MIFLFRAAGCNIDGLLSGPEIHSFIDTNSPPSGSTVFAMPEAAS